MKGRTPIQIKETFSEDAESFKEKYPVLGRRLQEMSLYHPIPREEKKE
jgi:hypothetical protein